MMSINKIELKLDGRIKVMESKIESLKVKGIEKVETNLAEEETEFRPTHLKPPPIAQVPKAPTPLANGQPSIRGMLMGELKALFKSKKVE